jgi:glycogen operon protein
MRIDHVLGLTRLFWVPEGAAGADGAYVAYPLEDLLGVLALESRRARCLVIGEDLGTVPEGLRDILGQAGVYRYSVLPFERDGAAFRPPERYPARALACVSTHDLPPVAGWWEGADIAERRDIGLIDAAAAEQARRDRAVEKAALLAALSEAGVEADFSLDGPCTPELAAAIYGFVAAADSRLLMVQMEDLAGERVGVNLPGTDRERPNWRLRLPSLAEIAGSATWRQILSRVAQARPAA